MVLAYLSAPIIVAGLRKDEFCSSVVKTIEDRGIEVFAPQFLEELNSKEIYRRDVEKLRLSDFVIAEVSNPSLGVGMEIMLAIELVKPILMFYSVDSGPLSKMALGAPGKALFEYEQTKDVIAILKSRDLDNLMVQKCPLCSCEVAEVIGSEVRCIACQFSGHEIVV
ncbi:hypothetical protein EU524_00705 [Candidatus Thorarchaeota archaeon]|jgi:nucleoside 2-deoxyribosyltransferase|nr:MAG: hypothetical protein EU524_00705 [Candidatus Thorarchaeota archaeon]